jgi:hypothetical protein
LLGLNRGEIATVWLPDYRLIVGEGQKNNNILLKTLKSAWKTKLL